jgi:hypothetical protein
MGVVVAGVVEAGEVVEDAAVVGDTPGGAGEASSPVPVLVNAQLPRPTAPAAMARKVRRVMRFMVSVPYRGHRPPRRIRWISR